MQLKLLIAVLTWWVTMTFAIPTVRRTSTESGLSDSNGTLVDSLKPRGQANLICCSEMPDRHGWQNASVEALTNDVNYFLRSPKRQYAFSPDVDHQCVPFCEKGTSFSIKICQDRRPDVGYMDFLLLANYVGAIKDGCGGAGKGYCGQQFDDRGFNVIAAANQGQGTILEGCPRKGIA